MAQAATVDVIGDDIYYNGQVVAVLALGGVPCSTLEDFRWGLQNGTLFESDESQCDCEPESNDAAEEAFKKALDMLIADASQRARIGYIRISELLKVAAELKDEGPFT